jgi:hypothetical protein
VVVDALDGGEHEEGGGGARAHPGGEEGRRARKRLRQYAGRPPGGCTALRTRRARPRGGATSGTTGTCTGSSASAGA